jgi:C4-dicarboxylate transporter, DctM subunit
MSAQTVDERLALGSVIAGGTLGILIPPSVMLIFYGLTAVQSIPQLFAAGMIPGLLLAGLQMGVIKLGHLDRTALGAGFPARTLARSPQGLDRHVEALVHLLSVDRRHLCRLVQPDRSGGCGYLCNYRDC